MSELFRNLIGGEWVDAASGATFETANPFTGKPFEYRLEGDTAILDLDCSGISIRARVSG